MLTKLSTLENETQFEFGTLWFIMISEVMPGIYGCFKLTEDSLEEEEYFEFPGDIEVAPV
jgi:hypothetical protein